MGSINSVNRPVAPPPVVAGSRPTPPAAEDRYTPSRDVYVPSSSRPTPPPVQTNSTGSELGSIAIGLGVVAGVLGLAAILSDNRGPSYHPYPQPYPPRPYPNDPWNHQPYYPQPYPPRPYPQPYPPRPYPNDPWHRRY